jgi:ABC-type nitrate/sulfonate/bicarbonate transport system ATPase subunit
MPASSTWTSEPSRDGSAPRPINGFGAPPPPLLEARGLSRAFDRKLVLRRMSLSVGAGEVVGLVAPNGSGKSTLLDLIAGVLPPDEGSVVVGGRDVTADLTAVRGVFYVPQSVKRYFAMKHPSLFCYLPEETVLDNLLAQLREQPTRSRREVEDALVRFGLDGVAGELPGALSVGMQQRLALARALGSPHPVLLLDEPLASVDRPTRLQLLAELGRGCSDRAVVYVTHDVAEIEALGGRLLHLQEVDGRPPPPRRGAASPPIPAVLVVSEPPPPVPLERRARVQPPAPRPARTPPEPTVVAGSAPPEPTVVAGSAPLGGTGAPPSGAWAAAFASLSASGAEISPPAERAPLSIRRAGTAAALDLASLVLHSLAHPPAGQRGLVEAVSDLSAAIAAAAERTRRGA